MSRSVDSNHGPLRGNERLRNVGDGGFREVGDRLTQCREDFSRRRRLYRREGLDDLLCNDPAGAMSDRGDEGAGACGIASLQCDSHRPQEISGLLLGRLVSNHSLTIRALVWEHETFLQLTWPVEHVRNRCQGLLARVESLEHGALLAD